MNSHPAKYRESFDEILIVFREKQIVKFVYQLNNTDYLTGGIFDGHAEDCTMLEAGTIIYQWIKSWVFISVRYVDSLKITFTSSRALMFSRVMYNKEIYESERYSLHQLLLRNP